MSYGILLVPRHPRHSGQTWEAGLNGARGRRVLGTAVGPVGSGQWDRMVGDLRILLVAEHDTELHAGDPRPTPSSSTGCTTSPAS